MQGCVRVGVQSIGALGGRLLPTLGYSPQLAGRFGRHRLMAAAAQAESACQIPNPDDPSMVCGAAAAADQRCLAHLTPDARAAYLASLAPGSDIDAHGVTFSPDLLTELLNALRDLESPRIGSADFRGATFTGTAEFDGVTFTGTARFDNAAFSEVAWFDGATFTRSAWFDGATFTGTARFAGVTFTGTAGFEGAAFTGTARFAGATFTGSVGFEGATFTGPAWFDRATFIGPAWFEGATFSRAARFAGATLIGGVVLEAAVVRSELRMEAAATRVNARGLRGGGAGELAAAGRRSGSERCGAGRSGERAWSAPPDRTRR